MKVEMIVAYSSDELLKKIGIKEGPIYYVDGFYKRLLPETSRNLHNQISLDTVINLENWLFISCLSEFLYKKDLLYLQQGYFCNKIWFTKVRPNFKYNTLDIGNSLRFVIEKIKNGKIDFMVEEDRYLSDETRKMDTYFLSLLTMIIRTNEGIFVDNMINMCAELEYELKKENNGQDKNIQQNLASWSSGETSERAKGVDSVSVWRAKNSDGYDTTMTIPCSGAYWIDKIYG